MTDISSLPDVVNWTIVQGDALSFVVQLNSTLQDGSPGPVLDLTGCHVRAEVKVNPAQLRPTAIFTCVVLAQSGTTMGQVRCSLSSDQTAKLPAGVPCPYDLQVQTGTDIKTRLRGTITAIAETTRG